MGQVKALGLLLAMGTLWGLQFAMLKLAALGGYDTLTVLVTTLAMLSVVFCYLLARFEPDFSVGNLHVRFFCTIALLGYVVPLFAAIHAAPHLPVGTMTLVASLSPIAAIFSAILLRSEIISSKRLLAVGLGIVSILLVLWPELKLPDLGLAPWILVASLIALSYGFESVYIHGHWPKDLSPLAVVTIQTLFATVFVLPIYVAYGGPLPENMFQTAAELGILCFVVAGVLESLIYFYLIRSTGGIFVNFGTFISLFAGLGWGIVLFGETHASTTWLAVLVLIGSLALGLPTSPAETDARD